MRSRPIVFVLVVCSLSSAVTGAVAAGDGPNLVRFGAAWVEPTGDLTVDGFFVEDIDANTRLEFQGDLVLEPDSAVGFWLGYERELTATIGIDVGLLFTGHDVVGTLDGTAYVIENSSGTILEQETFRLSEDVADIDVTPLTVGVNFHLTPERNVDVYVGPFLAYVMYGSLQFPDESISIDDELAFGAVVGVDVPFGDRGWGLTTALRYLKTEADPAESGPDDFALDVDPWIVLLGAAKRF